MRLRRHQPQPAKEPVRNEPAVVAAQPTVIAAEPAPLRETARQQPESTPARELFVRYARKDGTLVAMLRAVDQNGPCLVEAEVHPPGSSQPVRPGPYTFADAQEAGAFVTEAVTALMYLGCDIQAQ